MTVSLRLVAETAVTTSPYVTGMTVVALPPSDLDDEDDEMTVYVAGVPIARQFDPTMEQP